MMAGMPGMGEGMPGMGGMGGMGGMQMAMPEDFGAYTTESINMKAQSQEAQNLLRTDFAIQFVWTGEKPEPATPPASP